MTCYLSVSCIKYWQSFTHWTYFILHFSNVIFCKYEKLLFIIHLELLQCIHKKMVRIGMQHRKALQRRLLTFPYTLWMKPEKKLLLHFLWSSPTPLINEPYLVLNKFPEVNSIFPWFSSFLVSFQKTWKWISVQFASKS